MRRNVWRSPFDINWDIGLTEVEDLLDSIFREDNAFKDVEEIVFPMPGIKKDQIKVNYKSDTLTVEITYGKDDIFKRTDTFKKTTYLPYRNSEKITASLKDGILKVIVPFLEEKKSVNIKIN